MVVDEKDKKISLLLEDLSSLEDYIHDLFNFSPLPLCFISPLGVILETNPSFERVSNFSFDEIVGEAIERIFEEERIEKLIKETFKKGFVEGQEMVLFTKDKREVPVSVFSRTRTDKKGKIVGCFLGVFNLTEVKKIQDELKQASAVLEIRVEARTKELEEERGALEERVKERTKELEDSGQALMATLRNVEESRRALVNMLEDVELEKSRTEEERDRTNLIISELIDGLLMFDAQNRLSLINPQAEKLLRIKAKDVVGKSILELTSFPVFIPLVKLLGEKIKKISKEEFQVEKRLTLEVTTVYVRKGKEREGVLVVLHDVTREKIIERTKSEFVSIAAHQLRTPLSAIKWTLRMLLSGDLGEITEEQEEFIQKSYESNERMITLINDLLNVSRIEEGRYLYRPKLANIEDLVQSVIKSYKKSIKERKIKFKFERPEKRLPKIMLDIEKMQLAIENLIDNAIRYTPPGGEVIVILKRVNMEIEFSVKDTGVGIPKDQHHRVFTKFFRGANVIRMETEGSGLGLFITKNIVEAHGGKIWFESEEGKGTTFHFVLPAKREFEEFLGGF